MDITEKLEALLPAPAAYGGSEASQTITDAKHEISKLRGLLDQARRERDEAWAAATAALAVATWAADGAARAAACNAETARQAADLIELFPLHAFAKKEAV